MCRIHRFVLVTSASMAVLLSGVTSTGAATVGYWRFENDLLDISGKNNTALATGTAFGSGTADVFDSPVPRTGAVNDFSLQPPNSFNNFSAQDAAHYLEVPRVNSSLDIAAGSFTIEAWVQMNHTGLNGLRQYLVQQKNPSSTDKQASFAFLAKAGDLGTGNQQAAMALQLRNAAGDATSTIFSPFGLPDAGTDTGWHYMSVAVDRPSGNVRFVLDSQSQVLPGKAVGWGFDNMESMFIAAHSTSGTRFPSGANWGFIGNIDELRISNTYLPESQLLVVPEPASVNSAVAAVILLCVFLALAARRCHITDRRHLNAN